MGVENGPIRFRTLGSIDLRGRADPQNGALLGQTKRLALLSYLALQDRYVRRDLLLALLWPDLGERNARNALRQVLYHVRGVLGEDVLETRGPDEIRLRPDLFWCDARVLDRAYERQEWAIAAEIYQGEFMPGFHPSTGSAEFEFWLGETRRRLWSRAVESSRILAERALEREDQAEAVRWVRKAHGLDPLDEETFQRYLEILHRAGDSTEALMAYELFARRLDEDLALEPTVETRDLVDRVRRREALEDRDRSRPDLRGILPRFAPPFVGREKETFELRGLLSDRETRLLTLTGPGGVGKTRLAVELARSCGSAFEGVHYLSLASLHETDLAEGFKDIIGFCTGIDEMPDNHTEHKDRANLLILDNFEHVIEVAPSIGALLAENDGLTILVTSREPLRIEEEREFSVPPLSLPEPGRHIGVGDLPLDSEAIALFLVHARRANPSFRLTVDNVTAVIEVCRRLDGLPLALELAAARMRTLTPETLAKRLSEGTDTLGHGLRDRSERQRTLEKTIQWSVDLLSPAERSLLAGLSVFAGGMRLEAIEAVCGGAEDVVPLVGSLVEKHLVQRSQDIGGEPRYEMLQTIRSYATRLRDGSERNERRLHAGYFADWLEKGHRFLCTESEVAWHGQVAVEHQNVRAALRWCEEEGDAPMAARILSGVGYFWFVSGNTAEGLRLLQKFLPQRGDLPSTLRSRLLVAAAGMATGCDRADLSASYLEESVALSRDHGDTKELASGLINLGIAYREQKRIDRAIPVLEEALQIARVEENTVRISAVLCALGDLYRTNGEIGRARECLEESCVLGEMVGDYGRVARSLEHLGAILEIEGKLDQAEATLARALEQLEPLGQKIDIALVLLWLGEIARKRGRTVDFRRLTTDALGIYREIEYRPGIGQALAQLSWVAIEQGDLAEAVRILSGVEAEVGPDALRTEPFYGRVFEVVRRDLDEREFEGAWNLGKQLTLEYLASRASALTPPVELRAVP